MAGCDCSVEIESKEQRGVLLVLLGINALMFVVEFASGWLAQSTALLADSMDMLADAIVYGIGLYAVGRAASVKIHAAMLSGYFQIVLGVGVFLDVLRRFFLGSEPEPMYMLGVGMLALIANVICLRLISRHRDGEVHMRASWIFSKNDVIANLGVILAGGVVYALNSNLPDLIIGCLVSLLVVRGGMHIIKDAEQERQLQGSSCGSGS